MRPGPTFVGVVLAMTLLRNAAGLPAQTGVKRFGEPTSRAVAGDPDAVCTDVSREIQVCKAQAADALWPDLFLLVRGTVAVKWPERPPLYRGDILDVFVVDLDGDSRDELVIVDRIAASNGSAFTLEEVLILSKFDTSDRSVVRFKVEEYVDAGTIVRRSGRTGWWIFATEWEGSEVLDARRARGRYLVGRWFRYSSGRLLQQPGVLVRRYLNSFADERSAFRPGAPYAWFTNGKGRSVQVDPALGSGRVVQTSRGTIEQTEDLNADTPIYRVRLESGELVEIALGYSSVSTSKVFINHVGLGSSGLILPPGVAPTVVIGDLSGRPVRLSEYHDGDMSRRVMWID